VTDPQLLVGAICCSGDDLMLVRTGRGPAEGEWGVPSGQVRPGELLAEAVVRVVTEQASLEALCGPFIGWDERARDGVHRVIMYFEAVTLGASDTAPTTAEQRPVPSWDVCELRLVDGLAEFLAEHDIIDTVV